MPFKMKRTAMLYVATGLTHVLALNSSSCSLPARRQGNGIRETFGRRWEIPPGPTHQM